MTRGAGRALRMSYLVASVAGVGFFVMSVALLGVWPKRVLEAETRAMAPEHPLGLSVSELRGRAIYGREGCGYCHTQQIRYLHADMARFGAPTLAWETRLDYPHLWGTRRIGPDLSREAQTRSADWHFAHLFSPRAIVPESVMPAYKGLFEGAATEPRQEARDLVAYLDSLGHAREIAGPEGEARARAGCECGDDEMAQMAFAGPVNAHPARARRGDAAPALPATVNLAAGQVLYADHCATCHGASGAGDGVAAAMLLPRPSNLAEHDYTVERLADALWNGVAGTAMPAWREYSPHDLAAIAQVVRGFRSGGVEAPLPEGLVALGERVYAANCVQCHGERGAGNGPAAAELKVAPTNFQRQRPSLAEGLRALRNGVDGTPMAPWTTRLNEAELLAAAHYVRGLYAGDAAR
ncbi:MAG: cbb3-type cytochrome c oxidase subunit II [Vicinamibacterales bacterium]